MLSGLKDVGKTGASEKSLLCCCASLHHPRAWCVCVCVPAAIGCFADFGFEIFEAGPIRPLSRNAVQRTFFAAMTPDVWHEVTDASGNSTSLVVEDVHCFASEWAAAVSAINFQARERLCPILPNLES